MYLHRNIGPCHDDQRFTPRISDVDRWWVLVDDSYHFNDPTNPTIVHVLTHYINNGHMLQAPFNE